MLHNLDILTNLTEPPYVGLNTNKVYHHEQKAISLSVLTSKYNSIVLRIYSSHIIMQYLILTFSFVIL
jgi:hypothetical protein